MTRLFLNVNRYARVTFAFPYAMRERIFELAQLRIITCIYYIYIIYININYVKLYIIDTFANYMVKCLSLSESVWLIVGIYDIVFM